MQDVNLKDLFLACSILQSGTGQEMSAYAFRRRGS